MSAFRRSATLGTCLGFVAGASALLATSFEVEAGPHARGARTSVNHAGGGANRASSANRGAASSRTANVNRNTNVNRNVDRNVNRSTSIDRDVNIHNDIDIDVDNDWHGGWYDHPVATAAAVTATAAITSAVIGSIVYSVPPSCVSTVINGVAYQQCGSTWYQPQYAGTTVQYVVVNPPN